MLPFRFYLITDRRNSLHDPVDLLPQLATHGLRALQVRERDLSPLALDNYCRELLASLVGQDGAPRFFLNDRADLALSLGFAGVHLREESLPVFRHAPWLRNALMFGVSAHSLESILGAEAGEADFVTLSPIFATSSKPGKAPLGLKALEDAARQTRIPIIALGGITPERARDCMNAGASGVAAISAIWRSEDPLGALHAFEEALGGL